MRHTLPALAAVALLASALTACATNSRGADATPSPEPTADVVGTWDSGGVVPELTFEAGGQFLGRDECNGLSGDYSVDGATVKLGMVLSTGRKCTGTVDWLYTSRTMTIDGDRMTLFNAAGEEVGTLTRVSGDAN